MSPKACAEELGYSFLPCVLAYLHRTPNIIPLPCHSNQETSSQGATQQILYEDGILSARDVDAIIVPVSLLFFIGMSYE